MIPTILFYLFSAGILGASCMTMMGRNMVASVLFLILAFFNAAGLFLLMGAELLAFLLVIVYVGAIAVLFLFVVMMMNIQNTSWFNTFKPYRLALTMFSGILIAQTVLMAMQFDMHPVAKDVITHVMPSTLKTNAHQLGEVLYTHHILAFQLSGLILLVAMIGAIVLCYERKNKLRRQNIYDQITRKDTTYLANPSVGEGVSY